MFVENTSIRLCGKRMTERPCSTDKTQGFLLTVRNASELKAMLWTLQFCVFVRLNHVIWMFGLEGTMKPVFFELEGSEVFGS